MESRRVTAGRTIPRTRVTTLFVALSSLLSSETKNSFERLRKLLARWDGSPRHGRRSLRRCKSDSKLFNQIRGNLKFSLITMKPTLTILTALLGLGISASSLASEAFRVCAPSSKTQTLWVMDAVPREDGSLELKMAEKRVQGFNGRVIAAHPKKPLLYVAGGGGERGKVPGAVSVQVGKRCTHRCGAHRTGRRDSQRRTLRWTRRRARQASAPIAGLLLPEVSASRSGQETIQPEDPGENSSPAP